MEIYIYKNKAHSLSPALTSACFNVMSGFSEVCDAVFWFINSNELEKCDYEIQAYNDFIKNTQKHIFYTLITSTIPINIDIAGFDCKLMYHYFDDYGKESYIYLFSRYSLYLELYQNIHISRIEYSEDEIPTDALLHFLQYLKTALRGCYKNIDRWGALSFDYRWYESMYDL